MCLWPRGKCLGGSSAINYMAYVRGSSKDFDLWETMGAKGWGWKDVLPLFLKSECNENIQKALNIEGLTLNPEFHGTKGPLSISSNPTPGPIPQAFVKGATEMGFRQADYNAGDMELTTSVFQQTIRGGRRADTATCFLFADDRQFANLTVVVNAQATSVIFDESKSRVLGVEFEDIKAKNGDRLQIFAEKEVILSCGAIGSPQLLLLSGIGPKNDLEKIGIDCVIDAPEVGKNLEDHLMGLLLCRPATKDIGATNEGRVTGFPWGILNLLKWMIFGNGLHATSAYDATMFYTTESQKASDPAFGPDAQIGIFCSPADEVVTQKNIGFLPEKDFFSEIYSQPDAQGALLIPTILHMHSKGTIELKSSDPFDKPKINPNYFEDQRDADRMVDILKKSFELTKTNAMKEIVSGVLLPEDMLSKHNGQCSDEFWEEYARNYCSTIYHPTSTCAIGKVVDPSLRVFEMNGLRVADASVFPTIVSGNTNAAAIMVGEKMAEIIATENGWS